jgi:cobalt-zinc-cadmium efflux system membrane fusion protein
MGRLAWASLVGGLLITTVVAAVCLAPAIKHWLDAHREPESPATVAIRDQSPRAQLDPRDETTLCVPLDVMSGLKVTYATVISAPPPEPLKLDGSLFLDSNRLVHVRTRFAGEVTELGMIAEADAAPAPTQGRSDSVKRHVRFGDRVTKGQLLAVVWSKDLGEKKSELVERLTQLRLDEEKHKDLEEAYNKGAVPLQNLRTSQRDVETDLNAVARAERTLRSWRLTEAEIQEIRSEAEELHRRQGKWDKQLEQSWARVEVRAPLEGTVLEKNVTAGDFASTENDLFKIADLSRLDVLAHVYEEDISDLEQLTPSQRRWEIVLKADARANPLVGSFEQIGNVIDPNQHTALVMGWVDNARGRLRVGQFVTAQITLPASPEEVAVPITAVIDNDGQSLVLVASSHDKNRLACRRINPVHRRDNLIYLSELPPPKGKAPAGLPFSILKAGEEVVATAGVELVAEWQNLVDARRLKLAAAAAKGNNSTAQISPPK